MRPWRKINHCVVKTRKSTTNSPLTTLDIFASLDRIKSMAYKDASEGFLPLSTSPALCERSPLLLSHTAAVERAPCGSTAPRCLTQRPCVDVHCENE
ncbi:hypothetical protein E2C01_006925 [Portunus trituberculatus]|uniref:Uncharacterized protein n=1 Tax=Portunus trituberculatus TaxID=210409 RepID=A0A5B7CY33_PORTR|nr:hypothetical protein [Portunus trituberculatus]